MKNKPIIHKKEAHRAHPQARSKVRSYSNGNKSTHSIREQLKRLNPEDVRQHKINQKLKAASSFSYKAKASQEYHKVSDHYRNYEKSILNSVKLRIRKIQLKNKNGIIRPDLKQKQLSSRTPLPAHFTRTVHGQGSSPKKPSKPGFKQVKNQPFKALSIKPHSAQPQRSAFKATAPLNQATAFRPTQKRTSLYKRVPHHNKNTPQGLLVNNHVPKALKNAFPLVKQKAHSLPKPKFFAPVLPEKKIHTSSKKLSQFTPTNFKSLSALPKAPTLNKRKPLNPAPKILSLYLLRKSKPYPTLSNLQTYKPKNKRKPSSLLKIKKPLAQPIPLNSPSKRSLYFIRLALHKILSARLKELTLSPKNINKNSPSNTPQPKNQLETTTQTTSLKESLPKSKASTVHVDSSKSTVGNFRPKASKKEVLPQKIPSSPSQKEPLSTIETRTTEPIVKSKPEPKPSDPISSQPSKSTISYPSDIAKQEKELFPKAQNRIATSEKVESFTSKKEEQSKTSKTSPKPSLVAQLEQLSQASQQETIDSPYTSQSYQLSNDTIPIYPPESMLLKQIPKNRSALTTSKVQAINFYERSHNFERIQKRAFKEKRQNQSTRQDNDRLTHQELAQKLFGSHHTVVSKPATQHTSPQSDPNQAISSQNDSGSGTSSGGGEQGQEGQNQQQDKPRKQEQHQQKLTQSKKQVTKQLQKVESLRSHQNRLTKELELAQGLNPTQGAKKDFLHRISSSIPQMLKRLYRDEQIEELPETEAVNALYMILRLGGSFTQKHSDRVMNLSLQLANELGITKTQTRKTIKYAALLKDIGESGFQFAKENNPEKQNATVQFLSQSKLIRMGRLHDIGKIKVPHNILHKEGKLTQEEFRIIKMHPIYGEQILYPIKSLRALCPAVRGHHERYDGTGYPDQLAGKDIPVEARVIAIADVYDALVSSRPYKKGMTPQQALDIIRKDKGSAFDPEYVDAFTRMIQRKYPDVT